VFLIYLALGGAIFYLAYRMGMSLVRVVLVVGGVFVLWKTGLLYLIVRVIRAFAIGLFHFIWTHFGDRTEQGLGCMLEKWGG
jgi:hypothetical protein